MEISRVSKVLFAGMLVAISVVALIGKSARADNCDPDVVPAVDFSRYSGLWYEIAHNPNFFQIDCLHSTAEYGALTADSISVHNTCFKADNATSEILGVAKVVDPKVPAKLIVDFETGNKGDYWIVALDPQYQWAVVSGPGKKSLFILSRQAPMDATLLATILADLKAKNFDTDTLIYDQY